MQPGGVRRRPGRRGRSRRSALQRPAYYLMICYGSRTARGPFSMWHNRSPQNYIQQQSLRLGLMATFMLHSFAACRCQFPTIMTGAFLRRSCRMDRASGPSCSVGSCRITSSTMVMADRIRATIKALLRDWLDMPGVTAWCPSRILLRGRRSILGWKLNAADILRGHSERLDNVLPLGLMP